MKLESRTKSITNSVHYMSNMVEWATPPHLFKELDAEFHFTLDPCATKDNATCQKFYTKEDNGLLQDWSGERVYCNPPYGKEIGPWIRKCAEKEAEISVLLVPARTDTIWFHKSILGKAEIHFLKGRLYFGDGKGRAPFPSMIVIFSPLNNQLTLP